MDFDNPKVYGDTFISDGLVFCQGACVMHAVFLLFAILQTFDFVSSLVKRFESAWEGARRLAR